MSNGIPVPRLDKAPACCRVIRSLAVAENGRPILAMRGGLSGSNRILVAVCLQQPMCVCNKPGKGAEEPRRGLILLWIPSPL